MLQKRKVLIDNVRVRSLGKQNGFKLSKIKTRENENSLTPVSVTKVYFDMNSSISLLDTAVYDLENLC